MNLLKINTKTNETNLQRSIRYEDPNLWNELRNELKNKDNKSKQAFEKSIKLLLKNNQN